MPFRTIITDEFMGDSPYRFGEFDARERQPCVPEEFFSSPDTIVHYTLGYQDVAGESETTKDLLRRYRSPSIHETYTELEWEVKWTEGKSFIPLTEARMLHLLRKRFLIQEEKEEALTQMKAEPGIYTVVVPDGFLRHMAKEETSHVNEA